MNHDGRIHIRTYFSSEYRCQTTMSFQYIVHVDIGVVMRYLRYTVLCSPYYLNVCLSY